MKRILLTGAVFLATFAVTLPAAFVAVMVLAGPHSSMLPSFLQPAVLVLGWAAVILLPAAAAVWMWKRPGH